MEIIKSYMKKFIKVVINISITLVLVSVILFSLIFIILNAKTPNYSSNLSIAKVQAVLPFNINSKDITYDNMPNNDNIKLNQDGTGIDSTSVLSRAKAMVEVKWIPKYNLVDKYGYFIFVKGKTYYGIPYSMGIYQVNSPNDFLSKINESKNIIGNDCSGFVSAAWGISRQTTLSLLTAVKSGSKIDGKLISEVSYDDLRAGDAFLLDDGKGKGHIILYINTDKNNSDKVSVYEQNVSTIVPYEPLPVARMDDRSITKLKKAGYIPIRLIILS